MLAPVPSWLHATFLGLDSHAWDALGNMLLGCGAIAAGFWALYNYHQSRRATAAQWLQGVFRDFYLEDRFAATRTTLEYDYETDAGPLLEH